LKSPNNMVPKTNQNKEYDEQQQRTAVVFEGKEEKNIQEEPESKIALMSILEDIEDSRKALMNMLEDVEEERKKVAEERNRTVMIIRNFADGILVFDDEYKLSLINAQAEIFFGVEAKEIMGTSLSELTRFQYLKPLADLLSEQNKRIFRKELQIKENLILEISEVPLLPRAEGEKPGNLIITHDITREKTVERMKTEFVSVAAHQLRTPLSAIKWTLKIILDGDLGEITKEQRDFIQKTYQSNERMISLINDLLNVTRIEEGRYLYKLTLVSFEEIVQSILDSYKDVVAKRKVKVEFKKSKRPLPKIMVDLEKMKLAIQNLLDNALRYTPPDGKIIISLDLEPGNVEFSIKDTGMGIPKDQKARIFTKFFRAANVMKVDTEGSGLGLFIAKNIIDAHGGKIWFESEETHGTAFHFTLPIKKEKFSEFLSEF
jgi:PAS domain S-box-containing protein